MRLSDPELRILVLAPTEKDAKLTEGIFERAQIDCRCFAGLPALCAELDRGAGAVLVPEEILAGDEANRLILRIAQQPPWSDLPVLVVARLGADSAAVARAMELLGNVTVLERPTRVAALVSAARTALRARQRQYQIRQHLADREESEKALRINDRRKDEFLAILAHELRNPLAPIRNSVFILRDLSAGGGEVAEIAEMMERQVNHMVRLVDDLLEVSRITRDKIDLRKERVELSSIVRAALEATRPAIDAAAHRLDIEIPETSILLDADPVRLSQVLANLLNNAAKYTDAGGHIRLRAREDGDAVEISVCDNGTGISREMLPRVFDLFTQATQGSIRAQGGLGIGLTLVKRLVEMHGGTVTATSAGIGLGSEFSIRLPVARAEAAERSGPEIDTVKALMRRRVLVVDDNVDAADSLVALLEHLGVETFVAYGGADAIEALPKFQPAVVLLDIGMPDMDGHEVARRIRKHQTDHVTLIAMTGWGQEEDRRRSEEAGFDYHLIKPADVHALGALLRSLEQPAAAVRLAH